MNILMIKLNVIILCFSFFPKKEAGEILHYQQKLQSDYNRMKIQ
jgi:hypothetical protein